MTIDAVVKDQVVRVTDGGNLLENLKLIRPGSWQTSKEVFNAWQNKVPVQGVITANLAVYRLENNEAVFELLGREGNPFMDEALRKDAYTGILRNEFFLPQGEMKKQIKSARAEVTIRYSGNYITSYYSPDKSAEVTIRSAGLDIKTDNPNDKYGYVEFNGKNTSEEIRLFNAVYGTANHGNGKRVYLLNEKVVNAQLKNKKEEVIAQACYLGDLQDFYAGGRDISNYLSAVRGVRLEKVTKGYR